MKSRSEARTRRRTGPAYEGQKYIPERRFNPFIQNLKGAGVLSALQMPWYSTLPPRGTGVLTTVGRKTGKVHRRCIRVIRKDDRAYLVAIGGEHVGWLKNIRKNPRVKLHIRGGTFWGTAREVRDDVEREEASEAFVGTVVPWDYAECNFHRRGRPTKEKIQELHTTRFENGVPVIIDLKR